MIVFSFILFDELIKTFLSTRMRVHDVSDVLLYFSSKVVSLGMMTDAHQKREIGHSCPPN